MTTRIRKAHSSESALLTRIALTSKAYWGYSDEFMQSCKEELTVTPDKLTADHFSYRVIESDGTVHGYYALQTLSGSEVELEALFVIPDAIGNGLGKALMQDAIDCARQAGYKFIIIQSDPHADDFYTAMGSIATGKQESQSIAGRYLTVFKYNLNDN